ncbi:MAG: RHS repeat-associated core domain-containing protein [Nitrospirae bacterium]|nr:RHS repeat-associated core domain-containing protein [Nitrospirota bacterium]
MGPKTVTHLPQGDLGHKLRDRTLYTGREFDPQTGLQYFRRRYYDPSAGRFLQRDPISIASWRVPVQFSLEAMFAGNLTSPLFRLLRAGLNSYTYVFNNPLSLTDPWGLLGGEGNRPPGGAQPTSGDFPWPQVPPSTSREPLPPPGPPSPEAEDPNIPHDMGMPRLYCPALCLLADMSAFAGGRAAAGGAGGAAAGLICTVVSESLCELMCP